MKEYTFYFEIFGVKKKWSCNAHDEKTALGNFNAMLVSKCTINQTSSQPIPKHESKSNDFMEKFKHIFNSK